MPDRPNVLLITTDQQRTDSLSCYGSTFTATPHLDRLAAEGVRFDRAYCANPVCTPARASIFTGRYLSRHGAWNVGMSVPDDEVMLSHRLREVGYRTHYVGKMHFQAFGGSAAQSRESCGQWEQLYPAFCGPYYGFETIEIALGHVTYGLAGHYGAWVRSQVSAEEFSAYHKARTDAEHLFGGEAYDWDLPVRLHNSVWTADRAIDFLEREGGRQPFLLAVGFQDPHHPHAVPRDFPDRVAPEEVPLPDFTPGELDDKPPFFRLAHEGRWPESGLIGDFAIAGQWMGPELQYADFRQVTETEARRGRAHYYTMVRLIDREMGRVLRALDRLGLGENTLVIFTTDHGELLGDHGLWMKGPLPYEQLVRIPMILRWPAGFAGGRSTDALFSQVDLVPTVLAAVGLPLPEALEGRAALPFLRGETESVREEALIECVDDPEGIRSKTLVTARHKLTWYAGQDYGELYDLETDPREKVNLWKDRAHLALRARLLGRLLALQEPLEKRVARYCYA